MQNWKKIGKKMSFNSVEWVYTWEKVEYQVPVR